MNKLAALALLIITILGISILSGMVTYGAYLVGKPPIPTFLFTFVMIYILGFIQNISAKVKIERLRSLTELEIAKINSKQALKVGCAYCRIENVKWFDASKEMLFNCISCKQPNKILLSYGAARVTTPLNLEANLNEVVSDLDLDRDGLREDV